MITRILLSVSILLGATACASLAPSPTPLPTVVLNGGNSPSSQSIGVVSASGFIVPVQEAELAFSIGGIVHAVYVSVGDQAIAGQVLAEQENVATLAQVEQAKRTLRELMSPAAIAAAEQALAAARQEADTAQKKVNGLSYPRATTAFVQNLEGELALAKERLDEASDHYHALSGLPDSSPDKAAALVAKTQAEIQVNQLTANINWYTGKPSDIDVSIAHANLDAANAAVQEATWYLSALRGEQIPLEATGAKLAELEQAQDAVTTAQAAYDATRLISPIAGRVVSVDIVAGEYASVGTVVIAVSDVAHLRVETTDLSERDVPKVQVGGSAIVHIDALDQDFPGKVSAISPVADKIGGDVVYKTTVDLDTQPSGALSGMSVEVQFNAMP
jgi:multidrug efflux pump subunit AcrA (membrane-fusion protein)